MTNKDYKISVMVNKENYLQLRSFLLFSGQSFSSWLEEAVSDALAPMRKKFGQQAERDAIPLVAKSKK